MKSKNTLTLSVVIPPSQEAELTMLWAQKELEGLKYEILLNNWKTGLANSRGEYICFLERDCVLTPNYFAKLLESFQDRPSFRKLAMVAPSVGVNSYDNRAYGLRVAREDAYPAYIPSSSSPYLVQAAYLPGALIRRSAITIAPKEKTILVDSVNYSLDFWGTGQRIILDPHSLYITTNSALGESFDIERPGRPPEFLEAMELFRREAIG